MVNTVQFVFKPLHYCFAKFPPIAFAGAGIGGLTQTTGRFGAVSALQRRHDNAELRTGKCQAFGNFMGCPDGLRADVKPAAVFIGCRQPGICRRNIAGGQMGN